MLFSARDVRCNAILELVNNCELINDNLLIDFSDIFGRREQYIPQDFGEYGRRLL